MKKAKISAPSFWITPESNLFESPIIKLITKLSHRRYSSGKISPYKDQTSLLKLKSAIKSSTRQQSPKQKPQKTLVKKTSKKTLAKPPARAQKVTKKKKQVSEIKLHSLEGDQLIKAPKIFKNQIFRDVYDEAGHHDRIMDTFDVSQSLPEIVDQNDFNYGILIVSENIEEKNHDFDRKNSLKPPENSFLQETADNNKFDKGDLFGKLQSLAKQREFE